MFRKRVIYIYKGESELAHASTPCTMNVIWMRNTFSFGIYVRPYYTSKIN